MKSERIIVSLTTWEKRIDNIPVVLDSIFTQNLLPDIVVLNVTEELQIPLRVMDYLMKHNVEINRVRYKKVYKKLIPTLLKYPKECIINIDDDWLYPTNMIEDFWEMHKLYPNNPISGNKEFIKGYTCHCGCASLTKASFFEDINLIDEGVMNNCPSDDAVFTYFAVRSGKPYLWTKDNYYTNLQPYNPNEPYTESDLVYDAVGISWNYLTNRFGKVPSLVELLVQDNLKTNILIKKQQFDYSSAIVEGQRTVRSSKAYKIGNALLKPFNKIAKHK